MRLSLILAALFASAAFSQTPPADLQFEVASVRAVPAGTGNEGAFRMTGGPGTQDPTHLRYTQAPILQILARTFRVQADQLIGPEWITQRSAADRFDIVANIPAGATPAQLPVMLENLLKDRFHLTYHHEKRNLDTYELVLAKGGSKLQEAEIPAELPVPKAGPAQAFKGEDGYPHLPAGWPSGVGLVEDSSMQLFFTLRSANDFYLAPENPVSFAGGRLQVWRIAMRMVTIPQVMGWLQSLHAIPHIVDHTNLSGKYDIRLRYSNGGASPNGEPSDPAPDIFEAFEKQLGLKLQKTKALMDVIVIDHLDRTPVEN